MNTLTLIAISVLSSILFFITILFEGKLKRDTQSSSFFEEFKKLNAMGWLVIFIVISINLVETKMSLNNINEEKEKYTQDTIRLYDINEGLISQKKILLKQRISDSITIAQLTDLTKINLNKTDSINRNIILTAANESKRQLSAIELKNQNTYDHFKAEIESNYVTLLTNYESEHLRGFIDTTLFVYAKFDNKYINEYTYISGNSKIINNLLSISKIIDKINDYHDRSIGIKGDSKKMNIEAIIRNVSSLKQILLFEYLVTRDIPNYTDYETNRNDSKYYLNIDSIDNTIKKRIKY